MTLPMPLLKFLRRSGEAESAPRGPSSTEAVQQARRTARHRLIGAVVLLGIGVIGFPLVFQTQPRPIPVDIAIEIPKKDSVEPLTVGSVAAPTAPGAPSNLPSAVRETLEVPPMSGPMPTQTSAQMSTPKSGTAVAKGATPPELPASAPTARPNAVAANANVPPTKASAPLAKASAPVAKAPLPPTPKASAPAPKSEPTEKGRFVVQAGAYADADMVRDVRARLERQGLKTFIQTIEVDGAPRTRVRLGPFATRQEAQEALARVKASGLAASLIAL